MVRWHRSFSIQRRVYKSLHRWAFTQRLTLDELQNLGIQLELHYASFRRAIQLLRHLDFSSEYFLRRPKEHESLSDILYWSNHRVMEWLVSIDLSEYASTLRGSGIHGAFLVLEPRFDSEAFSNLLNIPKQKNLLRRHLRLKFDDLLTNEAKYKKSQVHPKDIITHISKYKPRKVRQLLISEIPKSDKEDIGLTCLVCPRPLSNLNSEGSTTQYSHQRQTSYPTSIYTQKSVRNDDKSDQISNISGNEASGQVIGGMGALSIGL